MKNAAFLLLLALSIGCNLIPAIAPEDFNPWQGSQQDSVLTDTIPQDSISVDTCTDYVQVIDPAFVSGYIYLTEAIWTPVTIIVGNHSAVVPLDHLEQTMSVLDSLLSEYNNEFSYDVAIKDGTDPRSLNFIANGADNIDVFRWSIQFRLNGYKVYPGVELRSFQFVGSRSFEDCMAKSEQLPSAQIFSCFGTQWDSLQYIDYEVSMLHEELCKAGGSWADFRHNVFETPQWLIDKYEAAGWQTVLHRPEFGPTIDLRKTNYTEAQVRDYRSRGLCVIVPDKS